jgi:hypothetical protein
MDPAAVRVTPLAERWLLTVDADGDVTVFCKKAASVCCHPGRRDTHEFVRFVRESMAGGRVAPLPGRTDEPMNCSWRIGGTVEAEQLAAVGRWHQPLEAAQ